MKNEILPNIRYLNFNNNHDEITRSNIYSQFTLKNNQIRGLSKENLSNTNYNSSNGIMINYINKNDSKNNTNKLKQTFIQRGNQTIKNYYDQYFSNKKGTIVLKPQGIRKKYQFNYRSKLASLDNISNYTKTFREEKTNFKYNFSPKKTETTQNNNKKKCPLCRREFELFRLSFHLNSHPSQIFPWLFLGSYRNACDKEDLKELNITYILNCAIECYNHYPKDFHYCHIKLNDLPSFKLKPYLKDAINFIDEAHKNNSKILVHCQLGISRSTSCVVAYMIKILKYTAMEALEFIKRKRKQVMPNYGFLDQLIQFEKNNLNDDTDSNIIHKENEYYI